MFKTGSRGAGKCSFETYGSGSGNHELQFNRDEHDGQDFPACLVIKYYYFTAFAVKIFDLLITFKQQKLL